VFGLRYGVGVDYKNYVEIYEETGDYLSIFDMNDNERYEPGFIVLLYLCHSVNAPVYILFSIIAFLQIFLLYESFKDEGNILIYIYATLILTGIGMSSFMNIVRHIIAFCFFLYSIRYIRDNKPIKYWICCLLALAFHKSAIMLFPLYFIWIRRKGILNKPLMECAAVLGCFMLSFITQWQTILHMFDKLIIMMDYENYLEIADEMVVNKKLGVTRISALILNVFIVLNSKKIKEHFNSDIFNILYDLYVIGICLGYIFLGSMMLQRIIVYFNHTHPELLYCHCSSRK
jgi:hypothetical protein